MKVIQAVTDSEISACYPVLKILRPHLEESDFLAKVRRQETEGYHLAFIREQEAVASVAGFRIQEFLAWGKVLYVDDLITDPKMRGRGFAGSLLDWLIAHARVMGCDEVHLDSGYQRLDAHRLYLNKGLSLNCHHFSLKFPLPSKPR